MEPDPVRIVYLPLPADGGCIESDFSLWLYGKSVYSIFHDDDYKVTHFHDDLT